MAYERDLTTVLTNKLFSMRADLVNYQYDESEDTTTELTMRDRDTPRLGLLTSLIDAAGKQGSSVTYSGVAGTAYDLNTLLFLNLVGTGATGFSSGFSSGFK